MSDEILDRVLTLELVRVTERAAVAASYLVGRGNEKDAHQARPITGTQINISFIKNLSIGIFLFVIDCKMKISAQD